MTGDNPIPDSPHPQQPFNPSSILADNKAAHLKTPNTVTTTTSSTSTTITTTTRSIYHATSVVVKTKTSFDPPEDKNTLTESECTGIAYIKNVSMNFSMRGNTSEEDEPYARKLTFQPGARTRWHSYAGGFVLQVLGGTGVVGQRDDKKTRDESEAERREQDETNRAGELTLEEEIIKIMERQQTHGRSEEQIRKDAESTVQHHAQRRAQWRKGNSITRIREGDLVWLPPAQEIWYGAPGGPAADVLNVLVLGVEGVEWMEEVDDEDYALARVRYA